MTTIAECGTKPADEGKSLPMTIDERQLFSSKTKLFDCFPGGNDTFLVLNEFFGRETYARVNQAILKRYPKFEQGAVLERSTKGAALRMQMTGGEFCGNATRSAAALVAESFAGGKSLAPVADYSAIKREGRVLSFALEVSGTDNLIYARVASSECGWDVEIELPPMTGRSVAYDVPLIFNGQVVPCNVVTLEGISHVLIPDSSLPFKNDQDVLRMMVADTISQLGWGQMSAFGLIWLKENGPQLAIEPVVYVKSIQTCIYESACGSGTIAVALAQTPDGESRLTSVKQPSGAVLTAGINQTDPACGITATLRGAVQIRGDLNRG